MAKGRFQSIVLQQEGSISLAKLVLCFEWVPVNENGEASSISSQDSDGKFKISLYNSYDDYLATIVPTTPPKAVQVTNQATLKPDTNKHELKSNKVEECVEGEMEVADVEEKVHEVHNRGFRSSGRKTSNHRRKPLVGRKAKSQATGMQPSTCGTAVSIGMGVRKLRVQNNRPIIAPPTNLGNGICFGEDIPNSQCVPLHVLSDFTNRTNRFIHSSDTKTHNFRLRNVRPKTNRMAPPTNLGNGVCAGEDIPNSR